VKVLVANRNFAGGRMDDLKTQTAQTAA